MNSTRRAFLRSLAMAAVAAPVAPALMRTTATSNPKSLAYDVVTDPETGLSLVVGENIGVLTGQLVLMRNLEYLKAKLDIDGIADQWPDGPVVSRFVAKP